MAPPMPPFREFVRKSGRHVAESALPRRVEEVISPLKIDRERFFFPRIMSPLL